MTKLCIFNHKGGVGKTTLTVNIADALADLGRTVLVVDADPQCNLTSFYLSEKDLDALLGESSNEEAGNTLWSAIMPVTRGRGALRDIEPLTIREGVSLVPGDVLLADHEEELPSAWTDAFARKVRGYDVTCAISNTVTRVAPKVDASVVIYDVGPNVGALNRSIILDSDFFITPVAADLFSLRALSTVGRAIQRWSNDWKTVLEIADPALRPTLLKGRPAFAGYISSAFKVNSGRRAAEPHTYWEAKIAPRVRDRIVEPLREVDPALVPHSGNKIGDIKHFHSLAPEAQAWGLPIGKLRGNVNAGHNAQIDEARSEFTAVAKEIIKRTGI